MTTHSILKSTQRIIFVCVPVALRAKSQTSNSNAFVHEEQHSLGSGMIQFHVTTNWQTSGVVTLPQRLTKHPNSAEVTTQSTCCTKLCMCAKI